MRQAYFELAGSGLIIETDTPETWENDANAKRLGPTEGKRRHREYARAKLLELLKPGDEIFTILRSYSKTAPVRSIDLYKFENNQPVFLSGYASTLLGLRSDKKAGIVIQGGGMDMGFELVYRLGAALWPDGTAFKRDGGYALRHRWL